ncbi:MAG: hypothetical protein ACPG5P_03285, partial [Saprospiraceae bacterium]
MSDSRKYLRIPLLLCVLLGMGVNLPLTWSQGGRFHAAAWNPVDNTIAISDGFDVSIYTDSFELQQSFVLFQRGSSAGSVDDIYMEWSPDGQLLAIHIVGDVSPNSSRLIQIWDTSSMTLLSEFSNIKAPISLSGRQFAWQPGSTSFAAVYFYDSNVNAQTLNQYDAILDELSAEWMPGKVFGRIEEPVWFPDGSKLAMFINGQLQIWDTATKTSEFTLAEPVFFEVRPRFSPDGQYMAFVNIEAPYEIQIWRTSPFEYDRTIPGIDEYIAQIEWTPLGVHAEYY